MLPKQREMDGIIRQIYEAMETHPHHAKTLLVVAGDHGMNAGGNHGGSGPGETEPALLFASPKFENVKKRRDYDCPTMPREGTEFHYYTKVEQSDFVSALAGLMGIPLSRNNLGIFPAELAGVWSGNQLLQHLHRNSEQILDIIRAKYDSVHFDQKVVIYAAIAADVVSSQSSMDDDEEELARKWGKILYDLSNGLDQSNPNAVERDYYAFLKHAQEAMSDIASSYNIPRMIMGMAMTAIALLAATLSFSRVWPPTSAGIFFTVTSLLYGAMMFASSYVEEEQHFWYWITPAWIVLLTTRSLLYADSSRRQVNVAMAGAILLVTHRLAIRWNQTGQKHAGEPGYRTHVLPKLPCLHVDPDTGYVHHERLLLAQTHLCGNLCG